MTDMPYIEADESLFGGYDPQLINDPQVSALDIGGYSDVRRDKELARRKGERVEPMPFRLHWVRNQSATGGTDAKMTQFRMDGYAPVKWEDLQKLGISVTDAAQRAPDGTVVCGDTTLMLCPRERAAANHARVRQLTDGQFEEKVLARLQASAAEHKTEIAFDLDEKRPTSEGK